VQVIAITGLATNNIEMRTPKLINFLFIIDVDNIKLLIFRPYD